MRQITRLLSTTLNAPKIISSHAREIIVYTYETGWVFEIPLHFKDEQTFFQVRDLRVGVPTEQKIYPKDIWTLK